MKFTKCMLKTLNIFACLTFTLFNHFSVYNLYYTRMFWSWELPINNTYHWIKAWSLKTFWVCEAQIYVSSFKSCVGITLQSNQWKFNNLFLCIRVENFLNLVSTGYMQETTRHDTPCTRVQKKSSLVSLAVNMHWIFHFHFITIYNSSR